ncbi:MAG: hypothetical protein ACRC6I_11930, partial [Paracoccaceae bacterium]
MELLLILLPLLAVGLISGSDSDDDEMPAPVGAPGSITRDDDFGNTLTGDADPDLILGAGGA